MRDDCVLASGFTYAGGYKKKWYCGRNVYAHRLAYCIHNGVDLDSITGAVIRHSCDTPACTFGPHLLIGTQHDNMADKVSRNRHPRGSKSTVSKLSEDEVRAIRGAYKRGSKAHGQQQLADRYGVTRGCISSILSRKTWKHTT